MAHVIIEEGLVDQAFIDEQHRTLRGGARRRRRLHARGSRGDHRRPRRGHPQPRRASTRRPKRAGIYYTLGITEHTHGTDNVYALSNLVLMTGTWASAVDGHEPSARPEQRAGRERRGRDAGLLPRLPGSRRPRGARQVRGVMGRGSRPRARLEPEPDDQVGRRPHQGVLRDGRRHHPVRAQRAAPRGRHEPRRVLRRAGHLPDRDGALRGRRASGRVLRGEGRRVHELRAPRATRAQGRRAARFRALRLGDPDRHRARRRRRLELRAPARDLRRDGEGRAEVRGHQLRTHRAPGPRHPVAVRGRGGRRHDPSCTRAAFCAARASSKPSSTGRRSSCPTRTTRCCSRRAARCTTTTRRRRRTARSACRRSNPRPTSRSTRATRTGATSRTANSCKSARAAACCSAARSTRVK